MNSLKEMNWICLSPNKTFLKPSVNVINLCRRKIWKSMKNGWKNLDPPKIVKICTTENLTLKRPVTINCIQLHLNFNHQILLFLSKTDLKCKQKRQFVLEKKHKMLTQNCITLTGIACATEGETFGWSCRNIVP